MCTPDARRIREIVTEAVDKLSRYLKPRAGLVYVKISKTRWCGGQQSGAIAIDIPGYSHMMIHSQPGGWSYELNFSDDSTFPHISPWLYHVCEFQAEKIEEKCNFQGLK